MDDETQMPSHTNDGTEKGNVCRMCETPSCTMLCVDREAQRLKLKLMIAIAESDLAASARQASLMPEAVQPSDLKPEAAANEPEQFEVTAGKKQPKRAKPDDHKDGFMATNTQSPSRSTTTMKRAAAASSSQCAK